MTGPWWGAGGQSRETCRVGEGAQRSTTSRGQGGPGPDGEGRWKSHKSTSLAPGAPPGRASRCPAEAWRPGCRTRPVSWPRCPAKARHPQMLRGWRRGTLSCSGLRGPHQPPQPLLSAPSLPLAAGGALRMHCPTGVLNAFPRRKSILHGKLGSGGGGLGIQSARPGFRHGYRRSRPD